MYYEQYNEIETMLTIQNKFTLVGSCGAAMGNGILKGQLYDLKSIVAWDRTTSYYLRNKLVCVSQITTPK